jgi:PAS domain S-box-containing protein
MPHVVWTATPDGVCDYVNTRWTELTGYDLRDTQAGLYRHEMLLQDMEAIERVALKGMEDGEPYSVECRFRRRSDGALRWYLVRAVPIRNGDGEIIKWFGTSTDIDEQKQTEEELRRANHDLEQFAYSASHDLQEPLRNIAVYSQLFHKRYAGKLDSQAEQFLGYMREGAQRMGLLVSDLLAYTQAAQLDREVLHPVDSEAVFEKVLQTLRQAVEESSAMVVRDALPILRIKEVHLQQLLQNLIRNAIKYRKESEPPHIYVSAISENGYWRFSVRDNGIGIEPQYHSQVFGLFKRLHARDAKYEGTGIGLAICQKIVERYGGRIWLESEPGKGTELYFTLPQEGATEDQ